MVVLIDFVCVMCDVGEDVIGFVVGELDFVMLCVVGDAGKVVIDAGKTKYSSNDGDAKL